MLVCRCWAAADGSYSSNLKYLVRTIPMLSAARTPKTLSFWAMIQAVCPGWTATCSKSPGLGTLIQSMLCWGPCRMGGAW